MQYAPALSAFCLMPTANVERRYARPHSYQQEGLVGNMKFKGRFDHCDHEIVWLCIRRAASREHSKLAILDVGRADCPLLGSAW